MLTVSLTIGLLMVVGDRFGSASIVLTTVLYTEALSSLTVLFFHISGTPASAGFGLVGLIGLLTSFDLGLSIGSGILAWILIPLLFSFVAQFLF